MRSIILRRHLWRACALLGLATLSVYAADTDTGLSPVGRWRTVDAKTGQGQSIVRIWAAKNGEYFGRIEESLDPTTAGQRCNKCTGKLKNQLIVGMTIIRRLKQNGEEYSGGDLLDPASGKVYHCKLSLTQQGDTLLVRRYVGAALFGRSQTWTREPEVNSNVTVKPK